jgi:tetratricopeptide (TPR) repeat protein
MSFAIGENVGPYRITAQLGSGGMATVYKAYHASLDRYVAVKVMHAAFKEDPNFLARFQREARIVARLEHPHIVPVYDFNEHEGQPYLVMRFIEGETLKARLQAGPLTTAQVMDILRPVCQALAYAHDQGVLHRDIKPSNILLTAQGGVFLTDFGLAKIAQAGESTLSADTLLGTPQYISPEQAQGNSSLDARTDIYSLGVVLYELLVGRVPFQADTPYAVIHDHIYSPLPMPRCLRPDLPEPFERVLLKALAKERDDRYTTVDEMLAALEKALTDATLARTDEVEPPPCEEPAPISGPAEARPSATIVTEVAPAVSPSAGAMRVAPTAEVRPAESATVVAPQKSRRNLWIALGAAALLLICVALVIANLGPAQQHLRQARQLRSQGQVEPALAEYQAAVQGNKRLREAYLEPAEMLMGRGQPGDFVHAAQVCEQGVRVWPNDAQFHTCAARAWFATNDLENAAPHLQWLITNRPGDALPHAGIAFVLLQQGQLDAAQEQAQMAVDRDRNAPEGHIALGAVLLRKGQPLPAREQLRVVLDAPALPGWLRDRAQQMMNEIR